MSSSTQTRYDDPRRQFHRLVVHIDQGIALMIHDHDVAGKIRGILIHRDQELLRMGHFFFNRIWSWYLQSTLTAIRAQVRHNKRPQESLEAILRSIPRHAASNPSWFTSLPEERRCEEMALRLQLDAKAACDLVDRRIAHRDVNGYPADVAFDELTPVIELLDRTMAEVWLWVFGNNRERAVVDVDPYWAEILFSKQWWPPTSFDQRLAAGREARMTTESGRSDYTATTVHFRRPTDRWLAENGMTREQWEHARDE